MGDDNKEISIAAVVTAVTTLLVWLFGKKKSK